MEEYNKLISAKILDGYEAMIDKVPQATMLGGKRVRKYVLPGSTEYDFPATLSVGRMDGQKPATLGGEFWKEFGDGFPSKPIKEGGAVWRDPTTGEVHSTGRIIPKGMKKGGIIERLPDEPLSKVTEFLDPISAVQLQRAYNASTQGQRGRDIISHGIRRKTTRSPEPTLTPEEIERRGAPRPKGRGRKVTAKSIGKALKPLAPVAKELGMTLAKEGIKEGVKAAVASGGRRRKKGVLHSVGKVLGAVGREVAPVARDIFHDVVVPEGKKALREYIRNSLKSRPAESGEIPMAEAVAVGKGRRKKGGALITNEPKEFHSSVYPPALASYAHSFPKGHDAFGRGRAKLPKSGAKRNSARGAIVAEVMKKHGMSLAEASKYVKEKGLY